ncbi:MAG: helix-turn-helix domain-containing protein [Cognatishimia sp.]
MTKRINTRSIRANRSYTVTEAAKTCNITKWTVRNWIKQGLPCIDDVRPYLITGEALRSFLRERKAKTQCSLKADEIYCTSCKSAVAPLGGGIEVKTYGKRLAVRGICPRCEAICSRFVSAAQIIEFAPTTNGQTLTPNTPKRTSKPILKTIQGGRRG